MLVFLFRLTIRKWARFMLRCLVLGGQGVSGFFYMAGGEKVVIFPVLLIMGKFIGEIGFFIIGKKNKCSLNF